MHQFSRKVWRTIEDFAAAVDELQLRIGIPIFTVPLLSINGDDLAYFARVMVNEDGSFEFKFLMDSFRSMDHPEIFEKVSKDFGPDVVPSFDPEYRCQCWTYRGNRNTAKALELLVVAADYMHTHYTPFKSGNERPCLRGYETTYVR